MIKRKYNNIQFKQNNSIVKFVMREFVEFYDSSEYKIGKFNRVQLPSPKLDDINSLKFLKTFIFINPNLKKELYYKFFRNCNKCVIGFNISLSEFEELLLNKINISYMDCYYKLNKMVYNEKYFSNMFELDLYSKSFHSKLSKKLKNKSKIWWDEANTLLLKEQFHNTIDNANLSYETLATSSDLKIEDVKYYLNNIGIFIRDTELEYQYSTNNYDGNGNIIGINKSEKKIIKRISYKDYVIEQQIKYLLSKPNEQFNLHTIINGCTYYSEYYNETVLFDKSEIYTWLSAHNDITKKIKYHRDNFKRKKTLITRQIKFRILLRIEETVEVKKDEGVKFKYSRNKNGKKIITNYFGEEMMDDYSVGNYFKYEKDKIINEKTINEL